MRYPPIPQTTLVPHTVPPPITLNASHGSLPPSLILPIPPTKNSKSIFAFWHTGIHTLPHYLLRNVINWYRRFSPSGWTIYVLDNVPGSPLNVSHYIDTTSTSVVPEAFINGSLNGNFVAQHTSDLIRYPLLLKYGGVYLDVGILQFGDLDLLWTTKIANPDSPYDLSGFTMGSAPELQIVNFALMSTADNPLIQRAHHILLNIWQGRTNTTGLHKHPLVAHVPLMKVPKEVTVEEEGKEKMVINDEYMTDYAIQIQCMGAAQGWLDEENGWDGPKYVREKCWLFNMIEQAYVGEQICGWSGQRFFDLLALELPKDGDEETDDQKLAREIVEMSIAQSWCLKLMHGFSSKLFGGDTLGMLWRKVPGSDCREGTYAGWLRWAEVHCVQEGLAERMEVPVCEPTMRARLQ